jgi:hypothetical protein
MSNAGYFAFAPDALGAGRPENGDARIQVVTMDRELDYSFFRRQWRRLYQGG